jgi:hypothetical protein
MLHGTLVVSLGKIRVAIVRIALRTGFPPWRSSMKLIESLKKLGLSLCGRKRA